MTVAFLRSLSDRGQHVPLCTLTAQRDGSPAADLEEGGIVRHDLGADRLMDFGAYRRLFSLLRQGRFDLVHAHGQDAAIMGSWIQPFLPFRLVVTRHVLEEPAINLRQRLRARLALAALRRADAPVAVSQATADRLTDLAPIPSDRIRVIHNGIQLERFDPSMDWKQRLAFRENLGVGPSDPLVVMPAVLRPGKGHDVLLDSAPQVLRRLPRARFVVAGGGELEQELMNRAEGLGSAVLFLGHRSDIPQLLAASDLVVLPSRSEALPTVAMEAAAASRAIVASRVGGVPEVVEDGVTGMLVPPGDPRALSEAITSLLSSPARLRVLECAARRKAVEEFGIESQVDRTLELWREVAGNGGTQT